jgi:hypothetical protein
MKESPATDRRRFLRRWAIVTLGGALVMTILDGLLLQRSKSFFTGGFLAVEFLAGPVETAAFLLVSLAADLGVIGMLAALAFWASGRLRLRAAAVTTAAALAAVGPLVLADIISYEIARYVGDIVDVSLALDLAGGDVTEILAVMSAHLFVPGLLIACASGAAGSLVWIVHRRSAGGRWTGGPPSLLVVPIACGAASLVIAVAASTANETLQDGLLRKPSGKVLAFVAEAVSDIDRDGFGIAGRMGDPDWRNAAIFP